ncbi:MAG: transposase [Thermoplasmata archaeon]
MKETLETIMNTEREIFIERDDGTKNGTYIRTLNTKYGFIDDLEVLRERDGNLRTMVFDSYKKSPGHRRFNFGIIFHVIYSRRISIIFEEIFQGRYSKSTISKITDVVKEEIDAWQFRPLKEKYFAIFIDALFINSKRK